MRIIYFDIDTLRPDHLGCYGYRRNTSPNIDAIAREGVVFEQCFTPDAPCLPSRSSLMTGTFGIHHGVVNHGGRNADFRPEGPERGFTDRLYSDTLPAFLKHEAGLHTVYIGGFGERHSTFSYYAGFREIYDTGKCGMESAEEVTPAVLDYLERNGKKDNYYLHINYWDPHTPYRAPESFGSPFANDPLPEWLTPEVVDYQKKHTVGLHGIGEINMTDDRELPDYPRQPGRVDDMKDVRREIDGYDTGVRYADFHVGKIVSKLKELGVYDDAVIIISSDHGENLGELGLWSEHATADAITPHIPLVIKYPGMRSGCRDKNFHYNIDLLPTLAELMNLKPRASWEGISFAGAVSGRGEDVKRNELVLSQCCHTCQRSVRWDKYIYIRTYHDFYHLFPEEMLFDLESDPHEQHNLAETHPELCKEGAYRYLNWHDRMMSSMPEGIFHDPMREVLAEGGPYHSRGVLKAYCERLEKTGRGWAVPLLKQRHPEEFK